MTSLSALGGPRFHVYGFVVMVTGTLVALAGAGQNASTPGTICYSSIVESLNSLESIASPSSCLVAF